MPVISTLSNSVARVMPVANITVANITALPSLVSSGIQASPALILPLTMPSNVTGSAGTTESEPSPNFVAAYVVLFTVPGIFIVIAVIVTIKDRRAAKACNPDVELEEFHPHWFPWRNAIRETEGPSPGQVRSRAPTPKPAAAAEDGKWRWKIVKGKGKQPERPVPASPRSSLPGEIRWTNPLDIVGPAKPTSTSRGGPPQTAEEWQEFLRRPHPRGNNNARARAQTQPTSRSKGGRRLVPVQEQTGEPSQSRSRTHSAPLPFPTPCRRPCSRTAPPRSRTPTPTSRSPCPWPCPSARQPRTRTRTRPGRAARRTPGPPSDGPARTPSRSRTRPARSRLPRTRTLAWASADMAPSCPPSRPIPRPPPGPSRLLPVPSKSAVSSTCRASLSHTCLLLISVRTLRTM
ncbi:hypothetical protein SODALDRAFT_149697 [Sodiomyces alkalinus F11]|uniref:Transmembrane protein n=1 Tax=Sodiomyces alkalinus (strain CBS 110278 / VKM F-3762 / F11) TaxID=1314773 RepID=A0A3N2PWS2_SODAK|nr:hypothetical protein SODALDRAFT_149697 [Sodiomyces alkalinus F11]ROT38973.1 hypothetical protein SODALDRAFT_149697 [Sodiomyces alkalinus F11]